ncbi:dsRBD fold-containing protein [Streptosporangium sp. NPDC002544]|uniref:dsRBD fold-containing protein n=1 Tax=Streptosporangium sp. NPDC002544 TaxID=3154538 RepID=UPI00332C3234
MLWTSAALRGGPKMIGRRWNVTIVITEHGDDTHARAALTVPAVVSVSGAGHARRVWTPVDNTRRS